MQKKRGPWRHRSDTVRRPVSPQYGRGGERCASGHDEGKVRADESSQDRGIK